MHKTWGREADSAPLPRRARASACSARGLFFLLVAARVLGAPISALAPCTYRYRGCVLSENICLGISVGHFFSLLILLLCVFEYFLLILTAPRNLCARPGLGLHPRPLPSRASWRWPAAQGPTTLLANPPDYLWVRKKPLSRPQVPARLWP